ncbi:MAG: hypothetical protein JWO67_4832, partial [Streptosporangiaceae bacterium]|nr:hypothetical protein [Streptosporangiaceae bacterium]
PRYRRPRVEVAACADRCFPRTSCAGAGVAREAAAHVLASQCCGRSPDARTESFISKPGIGMNRGGKRLSRQLLRTGWAMATLIATAVCDGRGHRDQARGPRFVAASGGPPTALVALQYDTVNAYQHQVVLIERLTASAQPPPGLSRWPKAGEAFLSPELVRAFMCARRDHRGAGSYHHRVVVDVNHAGVGLTARGHLLDAALGRQAQRAVPARSGPFSRGYVPVVDSEEGAPGPV